MDNTKHTAKFLASFFLNSKESLKYKFNSVDREIIRYLCDCIDMNCSKSGKSEIKMTFRQLSDYTGSSDKTVRRRIARLIELKIINQNEILTGQHYTFSVGQFLIDLGHSDRPPRSNDKESSSNLGHGDRHLTKASNNYSKQNPASHPEKPNQKPSPCVQPRGFGVKLAERGVMPDWYVEAIDKQKNKN